MICDTLAKSEAARKSAWATLQKIRQILQMSAMERIPAPSPKSFQEEGRILISELARLTIQTDRDFKAMEDAIAAIRPFLGNSDDSGAFPHALMKLNKAMDDERGHLSNETIRKLRTLMRS